VWFDELDNVIPRERGDVHAVSFERVRVQRPVQDCKLTVGKGGGVHRGSPPPGRASWAIGKQESFSFRVQTMKIDVQNFVRRATLIRGRHTEAAVVEWITGCTG
jgi:hypothetical protein